MYSRDTRSNKEPSAVKGAELWIGLDLELVQQEIKMTALVYRWQTWLYTALWETKGKLDQTLSELRKGQKLNVTCICGDSLTCSRQSPDD
ncbi:hypothetical protein Anapl_09720 [Anas platyrhynchos]|uniref:Uncharacterized protein n=1 Tax=Anas platyrhynchos TaxID=8839 RepID=R0LRH9_ANAPL|nr:hypothetical protein Anapl_09720 [Anas platyrhynchos]